MVIERFRWQAQPIIDQSPENYKILRDNHSMNRCMRRNIYNQIKITSTVEGWMVVVAKRRD